jgi:hypothetical protein
MTDGRDGGTSATDSLCDAQGEFESMTASSATITVTDLNNDELYEFKVIATDDYGNQSPETGLFTVTPINEVSVLDIYDGAVNPWGFDCQQSTALPLYTLLIFIFLLMAKPRK